MNGELKRNFFVSSCETDCSGCGCCAQICPKSAITMVENHEGFLYPKIDLQKCIHCGLCQRNCPIAGLDQKCNYENGSCFLATSKNLEITKQAATIGVCTMIATKIIEQGGVVFGAVLDESCWRANHCSISELDELKGFSNSKYLQSNTGNTFVKVKSLLESGKDVLYTGTPCQIAGLKSFLRKEYDNLFTIDIICHGVFSYKCMQGEIEYWQSRYESKVENFRFRSKRKYPWSIGGVVNFDIVKKGKRIHKEFHGSCSPTYRCYAYSPDKINYNLRSSCYLCSFRSEQRYGDLTVGDAWGLNKKYPAVFTEDNYKNGISLVFSNTKKALKLLDLIKEWVDVFEVSRQDAFAQPALMANDRLVPEKRKILYDGIGKKNYLSLVENDVLQENFFVLQKKFEVDERKQKVKRFISKIMKGLVGKCR